jgi:hypothetical protein
MKKNEKFSYNLSNLSPWIDENATDMLIKSILGEVLPRYATIRPNIKGTQQVGWLENDVIFQDGSCGFSPTGDTTINQVTIQTCNKKVNQSLCAYDLYDYFLSQRLSNSNFQESVPFEELIMTDISNRIADSIEKQLWRNTTATGGTEYNSQCFDGVLALVTSGNGATQLSYTAATSSNGLTVFSKYYESIPANVLHRNDLVMFCSYSDYRGLVASMRNSSYINLFAFDDARAAQGQEWSVMLPGTNVRVIPTQGLDGQSAVVVGPASYFMVGMNATENGGIEIKGMYDPYEDIVKIFARMVYGLGVFSVDSFVLAKN